MCLQIFPEFGYPKRNEMHKCTDADVACLGLRLFYDHFTGEALIKCLCPLVSG